jgi:hypothetical protein
MHFRVKRLVLSVVGAAAQYYRGRMALTDSIISSRDMASVREWADRRHSLKRNIGMGRESEASSRHSRRRPAWSRALITLALVGNADLYKIAPGDNQQFEYFERRRGEMPSSSAFWRSG